MVVLEFEENNLRLRRAYYLSFIIYSDPYTIAATELTFASPVVGLI